MYNKITTLLQLVIDKLKSILLYLKSKQDEPLESESFNSLSPIGYADQDNHYTNALNWALQNRHENDIRNIAITGPYGSGKSSVIKTFQKNYASKDLQFLNISLATFKEEIQDKEENESEQDGQQTNSSANESFAKKKNDRNKTNPEDIIRLIELSILQQIFYHANDSEIPESRFKKIKRINKWAIKAKSLATILFIISLVFLWRSNLPDTILSILNDINIGYFYSISLLYLLGLSYLLSFYIQTGQRKTFNIKLPIILVGINLLFLFYVAYNEFRNWESTFPPLTGTELISTTLDALALIYVFIFSVFALYNLVQHISRISINKLKFQDTEIEIDNKISKSILNHHLDEILYFFEATNYNVVIIEDLDRFQQTEIFTKLREINLLLNNSKKTKHKEIVFIYAVRDDMFTDKERSKFFDFIIPIIPVINSTNSSQQLLKKNTKYNYGWTEDLIDSLSIYIDDMRLLHNICNEFEIYKSKLTEKLDRNKLLAILVYKNLFPKDFSKLNNNEGNLWNRINNKQDFINMEINKIDEEIKLLTVEIKDLEQLKIINIEELRRLYLSQYVQKFENFQSFNINKSAKSIEEMCLESNFNYLTENKATYDYFTLYNHPNIYKLSTNQPIGHKFENIEREVDANKTYRERLEQINDWHHGKANTIRKKIQELEQNKVKTRRSKIKDILSTNNIPVSKSKNIKQSKLINVLLRNGYIDEEYHDFMSIFYEGNLTKSDNDFLISVKSQESSAFSYQLSKIEALVKKIHPLDFEQAHILNNDLITFLLNSPLIHKTQLENVFKKLVDESEISVQFIANYIDNGKELEKFINKISKAWSGFWRHIETASNIPNDKKELYFRLILSYADSADIQILSKNTQMESRIEKDKYFLSIIPNTEKLKEILETLDVDFHDLDFDNSPDELLTHVYENWNYKITPSNISGFIKQYGKFDQQTFDTSNYQAIKSSNCSELIDYIAKNLNNYVENVYLKIDSNVHEEIEVLIGLLNNDDIKEKNKEAIIERSETKIKDIAEIKNEKFTTFILAKNKAVASWHNIFDVYRYQKVNTQIKEISSEIINFINNQENATCLSKQNIPTSKDDKDKMPYIQMWKDILASSSLSDEAFEQILKASNIGIKLFDFENTPKERLEVMLKRKSFALAKNIYDKLENFHSLGLLYLEIYKEKLLAFTDDFTIDENSLAQIMHSKKYSVDEINSILSNYDVTDWTSHLFLSNLQYRLSEEKDLSVNNSKIIEAISFERSDPSNVQILNNYFDRFSPSEIREIIGLLKDKEYQKYLSTETSESLDIAQTSYNETLFELLKANNYIGDKSKRMKKGGYQIFKNKQTNLL